MSCQNIILLIHNEPFHREGKKLDCVPDRWDEEDEDDGHKEGNHCHNDAVNFTHKSIPFHRCN